MLPFVALASSAGNGAYRARQLFRRSNDEKIFSQALGPLSHQEAEGIADATRARGNRKTQRAVRCADGRTMSHHSIIAGLCFFLMLATILFAMFRSVAETDRRPIKPPEWFKCLGCGCYECEDGRQQFKAPGHSGNRYRVRECTDCRGKATAIYNFNGGYLISPPRSSTHLNSESSVKDAGAKQFSEAQNANR
jgi:hypothetical protein